MEENEDFMPSDQAFCEAEIYLLELQVCEGSMLPVADTLFSKIDAHLQHLGSENTRASFDMPLEILQRLLSDENWHLRQWIIKHVMDVMKADTPVDFIVTALNDTREEVCLSALQSCKLLDRADVIFITNKLAVQLFDGQIAEQLVLHALKLLNEQVIAKQEVDKNVTFDIPLDILRSLILDERWHFRQWAVEYVMGVLKEHTPADFVVSALSDTQEEVRLSALRICAFMGDGRIALASAIINAISRNQIAENKALHALEVLQRLALQSLKS